MKLLAEPGVSIRTICRDLHVSDHTVRSVAARENIPIAAAKKEVLANITHGIRLASERVIELMPEATARDALIGVGILGDKMALLSGEPTARLEINHIDIPASLNALMEEARSAMKRAKVIETSLDSENPEQKALMNGDHEQPRRAQDGAGNAVINVDATLVTDESENDAGEAI